VALTFGLRRPKKELTHVYHVTYKSQGFGALAAIFGLNPRISREVLPQFYETPSSGGRQSGLRAFNL